MAMFCAAIAPTVIGGAAVPRLVADDARRSGQLLVVDLLVRATIDESFSRYRHRPLLKPISHWRVDRLDVIIG